MITILKVAISLLLISLTIERYEVDLVPSSVYNKKFESHLNKIDQSPRVEDLLLMKVQLGYPPQTFHLLVDTNSYPIWIQDSQTKSKISERQVTFNKEISQSFKRSRMKFNIDFARRDRLKGERVNEKVNFGPETIEMDILLVEEYTSTLRGYDGILGVAKSFPKNKLEPASSLVPALKSLKKTDSSLFSISYLDPKAPKMYIGEAHEDFSKEKHTAFCSTLKTQNYWACKVTKLIHNNTAITLNNEVIFDTSVEHIYFPDHLKNIYKSIISKTNCKEYENEDGAYFDCISMDDWLPFAISFGNTVLKFPKEMLAQKYENNDFHKLKIMFTSRYRSEMHFGTYFMKYYHVLFDRVNEKMTFYSPNADDIGTLSDYSFIKKSSMDYVIIMVLLFGFAFTTLIVLKVVQTKLKKSSKKKFNEDFDETKYSKMQTLNKEVKI